MAKKDSRIDSYITKAAPFAQPVLRHLRAVVHKACPTVQETLKWGMPSFEYKGLLCGMAAFKAHCTFGFWKHDLLFADDKSAQKQASEAMGSFGRITHVSELPSEKLLQGYVKEAMRLNDEGIKKAAPKKKPRVGLVVPPDLVTALKKNTVARATFDGFSYSHRKEYVEWLTEAKRDETRAKRLATTLEWLSEGKSRHWKYANC